MEILLGMVAQAFNPSALESDTSGCLNSRLAWAT